MAAGDRGHAHHLIDPASGKPAWTGLICASARAPTALEATPSRRPPCSPVPMELVAYSPSMGG